jgi:hypothetical protein
MLQNSGSEAQRLFESAEEGYMFQDQYDTASLMGFQMSILCLGVALEQATPLGSNEVNIETQAEAERLRNLIESNRR